MEIKYSDKEEVNPIECENSLVIVGANGSGKSHLGAAIEKFNPDNTFRIVSQRAINIPESLYIRPKDTEINLIQYGNERFKNKDSKYSGYYDNYTITYVDDYKNVISAVLSVQMNEGRKAIDYIRNKKGNYIDGNYPKSILEKIDAVWKDLFPHRDLLIEDTTVRARLGDEIYSGKYMSDGERSALYLIAYSLIIPDGSILIIDEPELHFHRALTSRLFDKIEENCKSSCIVYLTHDLDFAASRKCASKIWIKSYDGTNFDLKPIEANEDIPEELYLEGLGCRQKVLFVEGENRDSFDFKIYSAVYDNWHVIPVGSCKDVQKLTEAFNNEKAKALNDFNVKGLIDHDYRNEKEIQNLREKNIEVLDVAEVENLFLLEDVVKVIASHLVTDPNVKMKEVKENVLKKLKDDKEVQIINLCKSELRYQFSKFESSTRNSLEELKDDVNKYKAEIDVDRIYEDASSKIETIIENKEYVEALKIYNQKGLRKYIGNSVFGLRGDRYAELVINMLKGQKKEEIISAMKANLPSFDKE